MNASIRIIKRRARIALGNAMGTAILGVLLEFAISLGGAYLASALFSGSDIFSQVIYQVVAFIVSLITSVFSAGLSYMYLNIVRNEKFSLGDLLFFFKNNPDRVIVASLLLSLMQLVIMNRYYYYLMTRVVGETLEAQTAYLMNTLAFLVVGQVLYMIVSVPFALTYYLMADDHEVGGLAAMKRSASLMKGVKVKFLLMLATFAPMLVLSIFLFYVPLLWILPHLLMCEAVFYDLRVHPEKDFGEEAWPKQAPLDYVNHQLGLEPEPTEEPAEEPVEEQVPEQIEVREEERREEKEEDRVETPVEE